MTIETGLYEKNKKIYQEFITYHERLICDINSKIAEYNTDQKVFLFGAHVFTQYLISFGLKTDNINCILDNDPNKHGKRLYGTDLKVATPKILADEITPVIILKAGAYNSEIKEDILDNINSTAIFIE